MLFRMTPTSGPGLSFKPTRDVQKALTAFCCPNDDWCQDDYGKVYAVVGGGAAAYVSGITNRYRDIDVFVMCSRYKGAMKAVDSLRSWFNDAVVKTDPDHEYLASTIGWKGAKDKPFVVVETMSEGYHAVQYIVMVIGEEELMEESGSEIVGKMIDKEDEYRCYATMHLLKGMDLRVCRQCIWSFYTICDDDWTPASMLMTEELFDNPDETMMHDMVYASTRLNKLFLYLTYHWEKQKKQRGRWLINCGRKTTTTKKTINSTNRDRRMMLLRVVMNSTSGRQIPLFKMIGRLVKYSLRWRSQNEEDEVENNIRDNTVFRELFNQYQDIEATQYAFYNDKALIMRTIDNLEKGDVPVSR